MPFRSKQTFFYSYLDNLFKASFLSLFFFIDFIFNNKKVFFYYFQFSFPNFFSHSISLLSCLLIPIKSPNSFQFLNRTFTLDELKNSKRGKKVFQLSSALISFAMLLAMSKHTVCVIVN